MSAVNINPSSVLKSYLTVLSMIASLLLAVPCLWNASVDHSLGCAISPTPGFVMNCNIIFSLGVLTERNFTFIHFTMSSHTYKRLYLPASIHV